MPNVFKILMLMLLCGCASPRPAIDPNASEAELRAHAMDLLARGPLIDGHNDTPWQYRKRVLNHLDQIDFAGDTSNLDPPMHTDLMRMRAGGVGGQFWSVYIPIKRYGGDAGDARIVLEQIDLTKRLVAAHPEHLEMAYTADDIVRIHREGRIASLLGMEGGHSIENSLAVLRATYELGVRYMTITHSISTTWADSATDAARLEGLSPFGREVIREMNRLGMMVDLSHVSAKTMHHALDVSTAPVIFSHSSAYALCAHDRNVPNDVLRRVSEQDGVVMVTYVPIYVSEPLRSWFEREQAERTRVSNEFPGETETIQTAMDQWKAANPAPKCTLSHVADHIDHIVDVAGIDHVGIGSDYDGIPSLPQGLEDASTYPDLIIELLRRGYSDQEILKITGGNLLRVMRKVEAVSRELQETHGPSDSLLEELDEVASARQAYVDS